MDPALALLYEYSLFDPLTEQDLEWLVQNSGVQTYRTGEYVFYIGDESLNFYIVASGQFETEIETDGQLERLEYIYPKEFFGEGGLLRGERRLISVRAAADSRVVYLPQETFLELLERYPQIRVALEQVATTRSEPRFEFPGQEQNELVIHWGRAHWIELVRRLVVVLLILIIWSLVGVGAFAYLLNRTDWLSYVMTGWALGLVPLFGWMAWEVIDWRNDFHIVTDRRVIHIERVIFATETRHEAPLDKIQDVNAVKPSFLANTLNFGDLVIQTASQAGPLVLRSMAHPDTVAERIMTELNKAKAAATQAEREQKRRELRRALGIEKTNEPPKPAVGAAAAAPGPAPSRDQSATTFGKAINYFRPPMREEVNGAVRWRQHWIVLVWEAWLPWLLFLLAVATFAGVTYFGSNLTPTLLIISDVIVVIFLLGAFAWFLWSYEDWRNDVYILTSTAIVDEERKPLGLNQEVRRAMLGQIQDVRYVIPNSILWFLNVGHVYVQTAGTEGGFTFNYVKDPREVQYEIFQAIQKLQRQQQQRESARLNNELLEMLKLYQEETREPLPAAVVKAEEPTRAAPTTPDSPPPSSPAPEAAPSPSAS